MKNKRAIMNLTFSMKNKCGNAKKIFNKCKHWKRNEQTSNRNRLYSVLTNCWSEPYWFCIDLLLEANQSVTCCTQNWKPNPSVIVCEPPYESQLFSVQYRGQTSIPIPSHTVNIVQQNEIHILNGMDPGFEPLQCLLVGTWKKVARLLCWLARGR